MCGDRVVVFWFFFLLIIRSTIPFLICEYGAERERQIENRSVGAFVFVYHRAKKNLIVGACVGWLATTGLHKCDAQRKEEKIRRAPRKHAVTLARPPHIHRSIFILPPENCVCVNWAAEKNLRNGHGFSG